MNTTNYNTTSRDVEVNDEEMEISKETNDDEQETMTAATKEEEGERKEDKKIRWQN